MSEKIRTIEAQLDFTGSYLKKSVIHLVCYFYKDVLYPGGGGGVLPMSGIRGRAVLYRWVFSSEKYVEMGQFSKISTKYPIYMGIFQKYPQNIQYKWVFSSILP